MIASPQPSAFILDATFCTKSFSFTTVTLSHSVQYNQSNVTCINEHKEDCENSGSARFSVPNANVQMANVEDGVQLTKCPAKACIALSRKDSKVCMT